MSALTVLYRGPLSSCNYGCIYCPFAKHHESPEEHAADGVALERFLGWAQARAVGRLSVFFTPWGEALVQPRYQEALARLSRLPRLDRVAIQTNLSARLDFLPDCEPSKVGIWATFHPEWSDRGRFLSRCAQLREKGVQLSVGVVGFPRFLPEILALRAELPADVYLWINAVKAEPYSEEQIAAFARVDPLFRMNLRPHASLGRACRAGAEVISVDGQGTARRCHFIQTPIGNLYDAGFERALFPRACTNATCGCHIGYVHLPHLGLDEVFGEGLLARVPAEGFADLPLVHRLALPLQPGEEIAEGVGLQHAVAGKA